MVDYTLAWRKLAVTRGVERFVTSSMITSSKAEPDLGADVAVTDGQNLFLQHVLH